MKSPRLVTLAVVLAFFLALASCKSAPAPGRVTYERTGPTPTDIIKVTATNDGAPKAPLSTIIKPDGTATIGTGGSQQVDQAIAGMSPATWAGVGLIVLGIALLILDRVPMFTLLIPDSAGWYCIAGGVGLAMLPVLTDRYAWVVMVLLIIGGALVIWRQGHTRRWFEEATGEEAQAELLRKGDTRAAGALAYVRGDVDRAKLLAKSSPGEDAL